MQRSGVSSDASTGTVFYMNVELGNCMKQILSNCYRRVLLFRPVKKENIRVRKPVKETELENKR